MADKAKTVPKTISRKSKADANDARLVSEIRTAVASLCAMIQAADKRGIKVDFQIGRNEAGDFTVKQLDIVKSL